MRLLRTAVLLALPAIVSACAAPTLNSPTADPAAVAQEAALQRKYVIERMKAQESRLQRVMYRISVGAAELCKDHVTGKFGFAGMTATQFGAQYEVIARNEFGFDDGVTITAVFPGSPAEQAGVMTGDHIVSIGPSATPISGLQTYLMTSAKNQQLVPLQIRRRGELLTLGVEPVLACNYPASIREDNEINAAADGQQIVFNTGLLNFATSEEELAVVGSHELSHNILDHLGKKKENVLVGGLIGLAADILVIAATGVNPQLYRTGERIGAQAYSVEFEQEADYEGLYVMRRAGYSISNAANFWRRLAAEEPNSITLRGTHPTTPERFLAMNKAIAEIDAKEAQKLALLPNLKPGSDGTTAVASVASGNNTTGFVQANAGRDALINSSLAQQPATRTFSGASIANSPYPLGIRSSGEVTSASITAVYMGKDPHGIAIGVLDPDGTAARAGVRVGDVIVSFNGQRIETLDDLRSLISKATSQDAKIELNRSGKTVPVNLHL